MDKVIFRKLNTLSETDYIEIKNECLNLGKELNWNDGFNQIMLQSNQPNVNDYKTGLGKIKDNIDSNEENYIHILPRIQETRLGELIKSFGAFRSRVMYMKPKSCYSVHHDTTPRLHLALETNDNAYFLFPKYRGFFKVPEDRSIYFADTRFTHSFMNGGDEPRIHLVMCTKVLHL